MPDREDEQHNKAREASDVDPEPTDTSHAVGDEQAAKNAEDELPG
jgi:hypothetical protein